MANVQKNPVSFIILPSSKITFKQRNVREITRRGGVAILFGATCKHQHYTGSYSNAPLHGTELTNVEEGKESKVKLFK
ncbi:hypothetical protein J6590_033126 [Homalodisca vitripennis]|nr:hypothetical protein J6590_033126 [Homalodisca vitripennis]